MEQLNEGKMGSKEGPTGTTREGGSTRDFICFSIWPEMRRKKKEMFQNVSCYHQVKI